jgi:hypothetical protein
MPTVWWQADAANLRRGVSIAGRSGTGLALDGAAIRTYDPWQDRWAPAVAAKGEVTLPEFSRSLIVRIDWAAK